MYYRVCPKSTLDTWLDKPYCVTTKPIWNIAGSHALLRFSKDVSSSLTAIEAKALVRTSEWSTNDG